MPGMLGVVGALELPAKRLAHTAAALDLLGRSPVHVFGGGDCTLAVATLPDPPLAGPFHHDDDRFAAGFAGDLHNQGAVPWADILDRSGADSTGWTDRVEGRFAVAVYDRRARRLQLFADHFGCQPVFYARHGRALVFSTQLAAFVRLGVGDEFDREWLHRFLFFGYWPGAGTFLRGVKRLGPGTVLDFDLPSGELALRPYEARFTPQEPPLRGAAAMDRALTTFRRCVPPMFGHDRKVQFALSGGLDSRTLYAFLPEGVDHAAFTYGMRGCDDQQEAAITARRLGIPHRQLFFDEAYQATLPGLIHETVWLSGGLAWINRCMLPAVYRFVAADSLRSPILSSGIALDTLFRGHNNARGDLSSLLATDEIAFTDPAYAEILPDDALPQFQEVNAASAEDLRREHGPLSRSSSYLSYTVYTLCPSYFTADLEIGGHYAWLRVPGYDRAIVKLAYELANSTVYLSKFLPHDLFDEYTLQAHLMAQHPRLGRVPLQGIPLDVFARRDKIRYHLYRLLKHGPRRIRRRLSARGTRTPIEDWGPWFATTLAPEMRAILHPDCAVAEYLRPGVLADYLATNRWPWLARLASAELILQLMRNGWELDRLTYPGARLARRHSRSAEPIGAHAEG
jgi:hypothetical protein